MDTRDLCRRAPAYAAKELVEMQPYLNIGTQRAVQPTLGPAHNSIEIEHTVPGLGSDNGSGLRVPLTSGRSLNWCPAIGCPRSIHFQSMRSLEALLPMELNRTTSFVGPQFCVKGKRAAGADAGYVCTTRKLQDREGPWPSVCRPH